MKSLTKQNKMKRMAIIGLLSILIEEDEEDEPYWPKELFQLSLTNFGVGRGKIKRKRKTEKNFI